MDYAQTQHVTELIDELGALVYAKYERGTREHAGNLWELTPEELLNEAICEAVDQAVYLLTLKNTLKNYRPTDIKPITKEQWMEGYRGTVTETDTEAA